MSKVRWADIPDDAPLPPWPPPEPIVTVSRHGIKVRSGSAANQRCTAAPSPQPPPDKTTSSNQTKKT